VQFEKSDEIEMPAQKRCHDKMPVKKACHDKMPIKKPCQHIALILNLGM